MTHPSSFTSYFRGLCSRANLLLLWLMFLCFSSGESLRADDWPTYRRDQRRSGVTPEQLAAETLKPSWAWTSSLPPASAWPDSARWDAYAKLEGLRSMRNYDPVFHPVIVNGKLYLPSNADDTVRCFDLASGQLEWVFTADAPVRIAPAVFAGRVLFSSDDGCVYAISAADGKLLWRRKLVPDADAFLNDGRSISFMPVRTGVLVDPTKSHVIAAAGMFPWRSTYLFGLDLATGEVAWERELGEGWTLEGALLLSPQHLIAPQGRAAPQLFAREDGEPIGALPGGGGSFVLLTDDDQVLHGPGNKGGWITASDTESRAKIASFDKGTAVVVRGRVAYLLDLEKLSAFDRETGQVKWATKCQTPHELILAGKTLFAGGDDQVVAFDAESGKPLWAGKVQGRAFGLAVADQHLVVTTDEGVLHVFSPRGAAAAPPVLETVQAQSLPETPAPEVPEVDDPKLLQRWIFQADQLEPVDPDQPNAAQQFATLAERGVPAPITGRLRLVDAGEEHAWVLGNEADAELAADYRHVSHPPRELTATAWVRVDKPQSWGGLISITQDNGGFEKGWILGFRDDKFGFALNAEEGPDKLTWVVAQDVPFAPQSWHHLAATYDGATIRLYVDGRLAAESNEQAGDIQYPPETAFHLGSYKDIDEHYRTTGMLNEVRLYERVLTADEIAEQAGEKVGRFPAAEVVAEEQPQAVAPWRGPLLRFVEPGKAEVRWWTVDPQPTQLELFRGGSLIATLGQPAPTTAHRAVIEDIRRDELLEYRIAHVSEGQPVLSRRYECDGHFDYLRPPLPSNQLTEMELEQARQILASSTHSAPRGIAVVIGAGDEGRLAEALSRVGGLDVIVLEEGPGRAAAVRAKLLERGVYGRPVSVRGWQEAGGYRLPTRFADLLVVSDLSMGERIPQDKLARWLRWLRPEACAILPQETFAGSNAKLLSEQAWSAGQVRTDVDRGWQVYQAPRLPGAAAWTHMYANPDNSAYAGETLSGVRSQSDLQVQWAGRPGPRYQADRGNRKPAPLAASGRLFMQGLHRVIAVNAHNGTILWSWELPEVVRFNVTRDSSNWCADQERLYIVAKDRCLVLDGATGEVQAEYEVYEDSTRSLAWGYVARHEDLLLGTGVQEDALFEDFWGGEHWYDEKEGEHAKKVCSDVFFARSAADGGMQWSYTGGLIVNPTITISDRRVHFVECRSEALANDESRRLDGDEFWSNLHLVALDARSGNKLWERPITILPGVSALYQAASQGQLVLSTSKDGAFGVYSFDAATGESKWSREYPWETNHHGKHLSRPALVEDKIYLRPYTLAAADGSVISKVFPVGHQCGTYTASRDALFLRAGSLAVWDRVSGESSRWERARPDCWISTIPAEGMLLSPEGGGGCSCGGWIETSMGFIPVSLK